MPAMRFADVQWPPPRCSLTLHLAAQYKFLVIIIITAQEQPGVCSFRNSRSAILLQQWQLLRCCGRIRLLVVVEGADSRVPQGSVFGPVLFLLYESPIARVLSTFDVHHHVYKDDLNIVSAFSGDIGALSHLEQATTARQYMTGPQLRKLHQPITITVAWVALKCKETATLLEVQIDSGLSMDQFIISKVKSSNYHLRAFKKIRPALSRQVAESVGRSVIQSRLDYCNSLLAGATSGSLIRLKRIQNQVARSVACLPQCTHSQPT